MKPIIVTSNTAELKLPLTIGGCCGAVLDKIEGIVLKIYRIGAECFNPIEYALFSMDDGVAHFRLDDDIYTQKRGRYRAEAWYGCHRCGDFTFELHPKCTLGTVTTEEYDEDCAPERGGPPCPDACEMTCDSCGQSACNCSIITACKPQAVKTIRYEVDFGDGDCPAKVVKIEETICPDPCDTICDEAVVPDPANNCKPCDSTKRVVYEGPGCA